jgi:gamma-glutamylcyclotransferase (GGCT)/AIG2-like uncharacterized protein YtfP
LWDGRIPTAKRGTGSVVFEFYEVDKDVFKSVKRMEESCYVPYKTKKLYPESEEEVWIWLQDEDSKAFEKAKKVEHGDFILNQFEKRVMSAERDLKTEQERLDAYKEKLKV